MELDFACMSVRYAWEDHFYVLNLKDILQNAPT